MLGLQEEVGLKEVYLIHALVECAFEDYAAVAVAGAAEKDENYAAAVEVELGAEEVVGVCTYLDLRPESDNFPSLLVDALAGSDEANPVEVLKRDCSVEV